ncbi:Neutral/alkaline non-lysosomal ceramidase [Symmachiella dynata]|uniref:neutral/alkaline non-lysosomal ceramidase N-terminal domain-containing protein n=1 Tax=Symmachiella dynata TaxID=2527995 RepID=UPI00118CD5D6|nr:neutral/alkaline non-lysosomal ceramidase N-terminal domain-containing protein [Symmachiella dynata]QDT47657.1 Neutral/alkaline non-lysosomal ceramidase [Symmachiella dynata]
MNRLLITMCALSSIVLGTSAAFADLEVGTGMQVITPDPLLPISGGMGIPKPATGKQGELTARAIVFRKGETTVAVVGLDLLGFPSVLADRVRKQVPRIDAQNIMIGSTHTHSGPDCYAFPLPTGGHTGNLKFMDDVCNKAAQAINSAIDNLQPAYLKIGTGEAKGKIAYNYYAPNLYDRRMSVIQAVTPEGKTIATLVNYAIHPEVLGNSEGVLSPDLVGPLCDKLEKETRGMALFMNGAQGGMITADNRDLNKPKDPLTGYWYDSRTWEECLRIGHLMADEAQRIVQDAPLQKDPQLFCDAIDVRFPVDSKLMWAVITGSPLKYPHNNDQSITSRINLVNIGDAQILTIPGEALPNIGFFLKRKMRGKHNLLFGLTNDAFGYILTEVDYGSFDRYKYVSETSLGEQTGEILIDKSLEFVNQSPAPDSAK